MREKVANRKTVFVSSVQNELNAERRAIKEFIQNDPLLKRFFDVFLFEDLPAFLLQKCARNAPSAPVSLLWVHGGTRHKPDKWDMIFIQAQTGRKPDKQDNNKQ